MTHKMTEPTAAQLRGAERAQHAIVHEINLMLQEGVSPMEILAGAGAAIADLITKTAGEDKLAPWFANQAIMIRDLQRGGH